ncbi:Aspartokinase [archaeon HR01]|nr:Aspartokinase [archaeon HR01]
MKNFVVVKFGGSVLSDEKNIERAAGWVKSLVERGVGVLVVVSALRGVTDELLRTAQRLNPETPPELLDEVLAMGERTSARLFAVALSKTGLESVVVDPSSELWPVITDDKHLDASPILEECKARSAGLVRLLAAGKVPVVCGYVGLTRDGRITTLGRGGSDTTAVLMGNCVNASEVILVKDVGGVYSSDPKHVSGADVVEVLSASEILQLSRGGAKVLHAKAVKYLSPNLRLRIGTMDSLESGGTVILSSPTPELDVAVDHDNVTMVTIIGRELGEAAKLEGVVEALKASQARLIAASIEESSLILYLDGDGEVIERLHDYLVASRMGKAISHFPSLSLLRVYGSMLETTPGVIHKIIQPLAAQAINIYGILTISSSIRIFVSSREAEKALKLIKDTLSTVLGEV